jgi:hypothetical protein
MHLVWWSPSEKKANHRARSELPRTIVHRLGAAAEEYF